MVDARGGSIGGERDAIARRGAVYVEFNVVSISILIFDVESVLIVSIESDETAEGSFSVLGRSEGISSIEVGVCFIVGRGSCSSCGSVFVLEGKIDVVSVAGVGSHGEVDSLVGGRRGSICGYGDVIIGGRASASVTAGSSGAIVEIVVSIDDFVFSIIVSDVKSDFFCAAGAVLEVSITGSEVL